MRNSKLIMDLWKPKCLLHRMRSFFKFFIIVHIVSGDTGCICQIHCVATMMTGNRAQNNFNQYNTCKINTRKTRQFYWFQSRFYIHTFVWVVRSTKTSYSQSPDEFGDIYRISAFQYWIRAYALQRALTWYFWRQSCLNETYRMYTFIQKIELSMEELLLQ